MLYFILWYNVLFWVVICCFVLFWTDKYSFTSLCDVMCYVRVVLCCLMSFCDISYYLVLLYIILFCYTLFMSFCDVLLHVVLFCIDMRSIVSFYDFLMMLRLCCAISLCFVSRCALLCYFISFYYVVFINSVLLYAILCHFILCCFMSFCD